MGGVLCAADQGRTIEGRTVTNFAKMPLVRSARPLGHINRRAIYASTTLVNIDRKVSNIICGHRVFFIRLIN